MKHPLSFVLTIVIFTILPVIIVPTHSYSKLNEFNIGIDRETLIVSGRYQLSPNYEIECIYLQDQPLGVGIKYNEKPWKAQIMDMPSFTKVSMGYSTLALITLQAQKDEEKYAANASLRGDRFDISGRLIGEYSGVRGELMGRYLWNKGQASLEWKGKGEDKPVYEVVMSGNVNISTHNIKGTLSSKVDEESYSNISLEYGLNEDEHVIEAYYYDNQYGTGRTLVGRGIEVLWTPSTGWLRMGAGHFLEDKTEILSSRYRLLAKYNSLYYLNNIILGYQSSAEGFFYSTSDTRYELKGSVFFRHIWDGGSAELTLTNTQRIGETPFYFDYNPERRDFLIRGRVQYRVAGVLSAITVSHDLITGKPLLIQGNCQAKIGESISLRFAGNYNLKDRPKDNETVFITEAEYSCDIKISGRILSNYKFESLEKRGIIEFGPGSFEIRYDGAKGELNSIVGRYTADKFGTISVDYRPVRPSVIFTYQPLSW